MQLLSALATKSMLFFRSSARAFGVDPWGARAVGPTLMVSIARLFLVSITEVFGFYQGSPIYVAQREYYKPTYAGGLRWSLTPDR